MKNELTVIGLSVTTIIAIVLVIGILIALLVNVFSGLNNGWWSSMTEMEQVKTLLYFIIALLILKS